jgi:hypothetical protein
MKLDSGKDDQRSLPVENKVFWGGANFELDGRFSVAKWDIGSHHIEMELGGVDGDQDKPFNGQGLPLEIVFSISQGHQCQAEIEINSYEPGVVGMTVIARGDKEEAQLDIRAKQDSGEIMTMTIDETSDELQLEMIKESGKPPYEQKQRSEIYAKYQEKLFRRKPSENFDEPNWVEITEGTNMHSILTTLSLPTGFWERISEVQSQRNDVKLPIYQDMVNSFKQLATRLSRGEWKPESFQPVLLDKGSSQKIN